MCGIVGVISNKNAGQVCYDALEKLEYRGYDSAGVAGLNKSNILVHKKQGFVSGIKDYCEKSKFSVAIAHTRWATHGVPSEANAHPILSYKKHFAVVHNGIIENYLELKANAVKNGVKFNTETDSEIICNLLEMQSGGTLERLKRVCDKITGSYGIAVICASDKQIYVTKKSSPIYVGYSNKKNMVASDILCFENGSEFYALENGEFAIISKKEILVFDNNLKQKSVKFEKLNSRSQEADLCNYNHFMQKEICETPAVFKRLCANYMDKSKIQPALKLFEGVEHINIIGCGTAYHAGLYGAKILKDYLGVSTSAYIASEFRYDKNVFKQNELAILISQSGETADTLGAGELCRKNGQMVLSITNSQSNLMARFADVNLNLCAGKEIGVASTKAYVAMLVVFYILANYLKNPEYNLLEIGNIFDSVGELLGIERDVLKVVSDANRVFFIGRQYDKITALEGALKLKEITYKSAEGYPAGELKHGTLALIENKTPVIVISTDYKLHKKTMSNAEEIHSRGGVVILVSPKAFDKECADYKIDIADLPPELGAILSVIPIQVLAYQTAIKLGVNPDKPRNLAKSVTVE